MKEWQIATEKFLERFIKNPYFEGALLTGSYATGNESIQSGIDIFIVLSDKEEYQERGVTEVDGYLINYYVNPIRKIKENLENEFKDMNLMTATMLVKSKALKDKTGVVAGLKDEAFSYATKKFEPISDDELLSLKHGIWSNYNELKSAYNENRNGFDFIYSLLLFKLVNLYRVYNKEQRLPILKLDKLVFDSEYLNAYGLRDKINPKLLKILANCFTVSEKHEKNIAIDELYEFVISSCGGFEISSFVQRRELKK